jgi:hypothetical protein
MNSHHNQPVLIFFRIVIAAALAFCSFPRTLQSASGAPTATVDFYVDRTDDVIVNTGCEDGVDDDDCSLRGAISNVTPYSSNEYIIHIPDGVYTLNINPNPTSEDANAEGDLDLDPSFVTLQGQSQAGTIIDGNETDRVLDTIGTYLTINDLTIRNGRILYNEGGGGGIRLSSGGVLTINRVTITSNTVEGSHLDDGSRGGGIYEANPTAITINDSTISENYASYGGGIDHRHNSTFIMADSTVASNNSIDTGGGIIIFGGTNTIDRCVISGNTGDPGGGVAVLNVTSLAINDSYFEGNSSRSDGGGITIHGTTTLTNVTFYDNDGPYGGGGISVGGSWDEYRAANLVNVTLVSNYAHASGGGYGGGLYVGYRGIANLNHVTLAENTSNNGNAIFANYGNMTVVSSILSDDTEGDVCGFSNGGSLTTSSSNLGSDSSCNLDVNDQVDVTDMHFGTFGNHGGLTQTLSILRGSPAIDYGNPADPAGRLDQRGTALYDGNWDGSVLSDSGAFEYINTPPQTEADSYSTGYDATLSVDAAAGLLSNDTDGEGDPLTAVVVTAPAPSQGNLILATDGSFVFTPAGGFSGDASFTYSADDGVDTSPATLVTIHVNAPPVPVPDNYKIEHNTALIVDAANGLLANDTDEEGDPITAALVSGPDPSQGTLALLANGSFSFMPATGFSGAVTFTYSASDGTDLSPATLVTIHVTGYTLYLPIIINE